MLSSDFQSKSQVYCNPTMSELTIMLYVTNALQHTYLQCH